MATDPFSEWPDTFAAPAATADPFADWPGSFRKKPATLAALDEDGPNSSRPMDRPGDPDYMPLHATARRDMSQLGSGLRAAGALPATTAAPEHSPLYNLLGLDVAGDTIAGAGRSAVNTLKALPHKLNQGTSDAESSLGRLARATGQLLQARPPGASDAGFLGLGPALRAPGRFVERLGGEVEDIAGRQQEQADAKLKGNPEADSILGRAVQGVPMLTGLALTGGTAGATTGMGVLGAGAGLKQAEDAGATPGQAWAAGGLQGASDALLGQIGAVPLVGKLLHGVPVEGAADAILALAKQGGSGALQAIGMDVAHGLARKLTYAKDTGLDPAELAKNAAAQALLQGVLEAPGLEMGHGAEAAPATERYTPGAPIGALNATSALAVAPFRGTWPDFLAARDMGRGDFAVLAAEGKRALRSEYDAALDASRAEAATARAAAVSPRPGVLAEPEPLHPAIDAAVEAAVGSPKAPEILPPYSRGDRFTWGAKSVGPEPVELTQDEIDRIEAEVSAPGYLDSYHAEADDYGRFLKDARDGAAVASGDLRLVGPGADVPLPRLNDPQEVAEANHESALASQAAWKRVRAAAKEAGVPSHQVEAWLRDVEDGRATPDAASPSTFPAEVFGRLVEGKPLRLAKSNLERDVGQAAKGLWPTGLLKGPADVQLLHDTLAVGGDLDAAVAALAKQGPVKAERVTPQADPPRPDQPRITLDHPGSPGTAVTDAGTELPFRYALANAPDLVTSHRRLGDGSLLPNPAFPAELQPRDRSRAASSLQVSRIAASLDPERLAESRLVSQGAPLVGPDGAVESGNARSLAIGAAYQGGPQAAGYRLWLEQNAARFGLDPAHVRALDQPVLVRQRLDVPGLDRVRLAQEANQSEPAAVADHLAATVPPEHVAAFTPGDSGAVESPTNATAVRETVAGLPAAEGTARWLLGSALGDQELAHRLASSQDRTLSRLADPLASVAPSLAEAPPELRGYLRQAVDAYATVRESGGDGPVVARLGRLLGHDAPEEVHRIASFLSENADHPEAVAQYLHRVAELHQQSGGQTGDEGQLSLSHLLEMAADRDQRQAAGSVIPLESSFPVARSAVTGKPGEAGFIDLRGPRFGEAAPIRRWFTREGKYAAMGRDFAERTKSLETQKDFLVKATEKRVVANVRDFGTALEEQMDLLKHADVAPQGSPIGPGASREDVLKYVRAGIQGANDLSAVTPALQEAAAALRSHLDEQSVRGYLQRPDLPASLKAVIGENVGSYFPRTFERITNPKGWAKGLRKDFEASRESGSPQGESWRISQAADWAQQQHPDWSREDAEGYAFKLLMDDPQAAYAIARGTQAQKGALGTESRGNLKARLGLPEELDNLLGLHSDPTRSYQIGAMRAARDLATYDLHSKVAQMGSADPSRPDGLTPDGQRPIFVDRPTPDLPVRVGGKGPLAEKYTSEQVAAAVRGMGSLAPAYTGFMDGYMLFNGAIKTGKIALNVPMGVARNMLTWPSLLLAGGHWTSAFPAKYAWETIKTLPLAIEANLGVREGGVLKFAKRLAYSLPLANGETVGDHLFPQGQKLADLREEVQRLTGKGILGQSTAADDLHFYTGQQEEPTAGQKAQKVIRDLGGIWSGEHDLGKHIVFTSEVANLKWANPDLPTEEIERMAAERTLATTPSRSEVSQGVRAIRAAPGISPFPTFAAERFRNMKNNALIAWEDLNSTNPQMKVLGAKRAAGLLTALTLAGGGASKMLQVLWNTGKEDADALREFLAEYASTHQIAVADRTGGKIRYADISPQMPLTGVTDPAMALLRGIHAGSTRDGMVDAAEELARPFMDPEFALKAGLDVYRNQEFRGNPADALLDLAREHPKGVQERPVYLKGGPTGVVAGQIGKYLWHNAGPAMGLEAERFARANDLLSNTNSRGKRYTNQDEMAALGGVRFNTIDMNAALTSVGYDLKDALTESKRYFTGERSSSQNDPKTVLDARAAANERWKNAFEIGLKKVAAARQLKIADYAIRQNLRISGVPPLVIGQLMAGRYSALPLRMPYRQPVDYAGAAAAPAEDE